MIELLQKIRGWFMRDEDACNQHIEISEEVLERLIRHD